MIPETIKKTPRLQEVIDTPEFQKYKTGGKSNLEAYNAFSADYQASAGTSLRAEQKQTNTKASATSTNAKLAYSAGALAEGSTKRGFFEKALGSVSGTATRALTGANQTAGSINEELGKFNEWMILQTRNLAKTSSFLSEGINDATSGITGSIAGLSEGITSEIQSWKQEMNEALKPVSTSIGSAVGTLESVVRDPLGAPQMLSNGMMYVLDKISPRFANEVEGAFKGIELENLANLPGQMMGSLRSLTLAADALLSVPFTIISDIYNGLLDIMEEIANLIDSVVSAIFDFFFGPGGLLDSILPISEILSLLEAIGELANFVGGIAQLAGGFNVVTNITGQITGAVSDISSIIQNPLQLAQSYIPGFNQATGAIGQVTGALRNPEQFIPASVKGQIDKISSIPGLGFVSNFGTSIGDTLEGLKGGVLTKAFDEYAKQIPIIAPLLNQQPGADQQAAVNTQEAYSDNYVPSSVRSDQETTNGQHVALFEGQTSPYKIFQENQQQNKGSVSATFGRTTVVENVDGTVTTSNNGQLISSSGPRGTFAYGINQPVETISLLGTNQNPFGSLQ